MTRWDDQSPLCQKEDPLFFSGVLLLPSENMQLTKMVSFDQPCFEEEIFFVSYNV